MKTILAILKKAGGWHHGLYLTVENPPYVALVIDAMDESGPCGLPALSVAQYSDALAKPEMCFELGLAGGAHLTPFYYRDDDAGVEQFSRTIDGENYVFLPDLHDQHQKFAALWDRNLRAQGFVEVFERQQQKPRA
jgi:hypothetical protein